MPWEMILREIMSWLVHKMRAERWLSEKNDCERDYQYSTPAWMSKEWHRCAALALGSKGWWMPSWMSYGPAQDLVSKIHLQTHTHTHTHTHTCIYECVKEIYRHICNGKMYTLYMALKCLHEARHRGGQLSSWHLEAERRGSPWVQAKSDLHSEFRFIMESIVRLCLNKATNNIKKKNLCLWKWLSL